MIIKYPSGIDSQTWSIVIIDPLGTKRTSSFTQKHNSTPQLSLISTNSINPSTNTIVSLLRINMQSDIPTSGKLVNIKD